MLIREDVHSNIGKEGKSASLSFRSVRSQALLRTKTYFSTVLGTLSAYNSNMTLLDTRRSIDRRARNASVTGPLHGMLFQSMLLLHSDIACSTSCFSHSCLMPCHTMPCLHASFFLSRQLQPNAAYMEHTTHRPILSPFCAKSMKHRGFTILTFLKLA